MLRPEYGTNGSSGPFAKISNGRLRKGRRVSMVDLEMLVAHAAPQHGGLGPEAAAGHEAM